MHKLSQIVITVFVVGIYSFNILTFIRKNNISVNFAKEKQEFTIEKKDESLSVDFVAKHNNLGIISIHLVSESHQDVNVSLTEMSSGIQVHSFIVDTFSLGKIEYYTFGFPIQSNSRDKHYSFRITSTNDEMLNLRIDSRSSNGFVTYKLIENGNVGNIWSILIFRIKTILNENLLVAELIYQSMGLLLLIPLFVVFSINRENGHKKLPSQISPINWEIFSPYVLSWLTVFFVNLQYAFSYWYNIIGLILIALLLIKPFRKKIRKILCFASIVTLTQMIANSITKQNAIADRCGSWMLLFILVLLICNIVQFDKDH